MPTKLRRIAVTVDPELEAALALARHELPGPDSAIVRELALRGARTVPSIAPDHLRWLRSVGATLPTRRLSDLPIPERPGATTPTEALEWVRGER